MATTVLIRALLVSHAAVAVAECLTILPRPISDPPIWVEAQSLPLRIRVPSEQARSSATSRCTAC
jgi:hypothetical protein